MVPVCQVLKHVSDPLVSPGNGITTFSCPLTILRCRSKTTSGPYPVIPKVEELGNADATANGVTIDCLSAEVPIVFYDMDVFDEAEDSVVECSRGLRATVWLEALL
jgi:hypothetical protein